MAHCNYVLKAGVLLQAFSDASKTCTNANLTDELAQFHLKRDPSCARFFAVMPGLPDIPDHISLPRQKGPTIIMPPEKEVPKVASDFVSATLTPPVIAQPLVKEVPEVVIKSPVKKKVAATKRKK